MAQLRIGGDVDMASPEYAEAINELEQRAAAISWLKRRARIITSNKLLIDGGFIASIRTGEFKLWQRENNNVNTLRMK